jgi:tetratricopeptide (TPR) repeat protein
LRYTALQGNPDDVGGLVVVPALVAVALVLTDRARRALWVPVAALLLLALATGRLTALIACGAALLTMAFLRSKRGAIIGTAVLVVAAIGLVGGYRPMRERATGIVAALRTHNYAEATSGRVTPFIAAATMAKDHPLFGIGPGCFRWHYFDYKLAAERAHPSLAKAWSADYNFAETHNEHLQTLAETGIAGYAIFAAALIVLGTSSRRKQEEESERDALVRTLALPLAVGIGILCLAHFPLHLAASTVVIIYVAALCVAWGAYAEIAASPMRARVAALLRSRSLPMPLAASLTILVAIGGALLAWRLAWQPWQCNIAKKEIEARTNMAYDVVVDTFRVSRMARTNMAALEPCLAAMPTDVSLYMLAAANDRLVGRVDEAATMYRKALQYDRRPELYYNLGLMELALKQRGPAVADLLTAVRFSRQYLADLPIDVQNEIMDALRRQYPHLVGS